MSKVELFAVSYAVISSANGLDALRFDAKPSPEARTILKGDAMQGEYASKHNVWLVSTADRSALDASLLATKKAQAKEARALAPKSPQKNVKQIVPGISTAKAKIAALMLAQGIEASKVEAVVGLAPGSLSM